MVIPNLSIMVLDSANEERVPRANVERTIKRYLEDEWCAKRSSQQELTFQDCRYTAPANKQHGLRCFLDEKL